jgi:RNA polymerase sigma-70 factor, ECF subfamily
MQADKEKKVNRDFHSTATIPLGSELIKRAQQGDAEAFASLFHAHKARVYALCLRMTNNVAEAEDLLQDAFLHVFRKLSSFRGASALSTWIYRIAINTVLMHFRKKSPCQVSLDEPYSNHEHAKPIRREYAARDGRLDSCVTRLVLTRAISALPSGSREIFLLHEVEGYEHHEIAEMLGCSVGNSKSQLHRAKLRLRNFLARRRIARAETGRANGLHTVRAMEQSASLAETWALSPASRIKNMVPFAQSNA